MDEPDDGVLTLTLPKAKQAQPTPCTATWHDPMPPSLERLRREEGLTVWSCSSSSFPARASPVRKL